MTSHHKLLIQGILIIIASAGIAAGLLFLQKPKPAEQSAIFSEPHSRSRSVVLTGAESPEELQVLADKAYADRLVQSTSSPNTIIYNNPDYGFKISFPSDFKPVIAGWDTNRYIVLSRKVGNGKWDLRIGFSANDAINMQDSSHQLNATFRGQKASLIGGPYEGGYMDGAGSKLPTGVHYRLTVYKDNSDEAADSMYRKGYEIEYGVSMAYDVTNGSDIMSDEEVKAYGDAVAVFNTYKPEIDKIISTFEIIK